MFTKLHLLVIILISLTSCRYPEDPNQTLTKIQTQHLIKIGTCSNSQDDGLLEDLSYRLNVKILKIKESPDRLFKMLENNEIYLVSCNIQKDNPWKEKVAFTIPYHSNYVWAIRQGENAWLKYLNDFIYQRAD